MNTQLAIEALLPIFYSHICNFADMMIVNVISHVSGYKRKDYISMLKILLMLIILNGSDAQLKRSWHSCVMWRVCEKLYWTQRLVMFTTAEQNDFSLHFINVLWSFSFQTGITLGSVSKCYQCGSVGGVTDDNCFDDKVESSYSPTDCGLGIWKNCTVSRYYFDISTPDLKEGENVFSNTLNTPHLDFSYKHPEGTSNDSDICDCSKVSDYNSGLWEFFFTPVNYSKHFS